MDPSCLSLLPTPNMAGNFPVATKDKAELRGRPRQGWDNGALYPRNQNWVGGPSQGRWGPSSLCTQGLPACQDPTQTHCQVGGKGESWLEPCTAHPGGRHCVCQQTMPGLQWCLLCRVSPLRTDGRNHLRYPLPAGRALPFRNSSRLHIWEHQGPDLSPRRKPGILGGARALGGRGSQKGLRNPGRRGHSSSYRRPASHLLPDWGPTAPAGTGRCVEAGSSQVPGPTPPSPPPRRRPRPALGPSRFVPGLGPRSRGRRTKLLLCPEASGGAL